jgi:hypothetical protein
MQFGHEGTHIFAHRKTFLFLLLKINVRSSECQQTCLVGRVATYEDTCQSIGNLLPFFIPLFSLSIHRKLSQTKEKVFCEPLRAEKMRKFAAWKKAWSI